MKLFVVSDVHSYYDEMIKALDEKGFDINNKNHVFVSLGDLLDRGNKPKECIDFVNSIPDNRKILILGNHEVLMSQMLNRGFAQGHDISNGTSASVYKYLWTNPNDCSEKEAFDCFKHDEGWNKYLNSCMDYWENNKYVFVHGWIPCLCHGGYYYGRVYGPAYTPDWRTMSFENARWYNGMELWHDGVKIPNKTIFCGHWHASFGNSHYHHDGVEWLEVEDDNGDLLNMPVNYFPFEDDGIVAMDACTCVSRIVNCKVIERVRKIDVERKITSN